MKKDLKFEEEILFPNHEACYFCGKDMSSLNSYWCTFIEINGKGYQVLICDDCDEQQREESIQAYIKKHGQKKFDDMIAEETKLKERHETYTQ